MNIFTCFWLHEHIVFKRGFALLCYFVLVVSLTRISNEPLPINKLLSPVSRQHFFICQSQTLTISVVITIWEFLIYYQIFISPQVKHSVLIVNLIISVPECSRSGWLTFFFFLIGDVKQSKSLTAFPRKQRICNRRILYREFNIHWKATYKRIHNNWPQTHP